MTGLSIDIRHTVGDLVLEIAEVVPPGGVTALLGPNGAGKSTLLRLVAGLDRPEAGRITWREDTFADTATGTWRDPETRPVGVVFQRYMLFPTLDARDNVAYGLRSRGVRRAAARGRAEHWLDRVGVAARSGARPAQLSGGEAQRVALARALAVEPELLLLDEPLGALDAETKVQIRALLRHLLPQVEATAVLVTHDPVDALALADTIVVLEGGRVTQAGTVRELRAAPRSPYAAALAGVNLFLGTASRRDGRHVIQVDGAEVVAAESPDGAVLAIVRPNAVAVHLAHPEGSPSNVYEARVEALEPVGERVRVRAAGALALVAELTPEAVGRLELRPGTRIWTSFKATDVDVSPA